MGWRHEERYSALDVGYLGSIRCWTVRFFVPVALAMIKIFNSFMVGQDIL